MTRAMAVVLALTTASCVTIGSRGGKEKDPRIIGYGVAGDLVMVAIPTTKVYMDAEDGTFTGGLKTFAIGSLILVGVDLLIYAAAR